MGTALEVILATECRGEFVGWDGMKMLVNSRSFALGVELADIDAGCTAERILATQDGRGAILTEWHRGECVTEVYFEEFTTAGRTSHGWIDAETRKLVQAG